MTYASYMTPSFPLANKCHGTFGAFVFSRELDVAESGPIAFENFQNLLVGKYRSFVRFATALSGFRILCANSPLLLAIIHVLPTGAKPKMFRVNTKAVVARMADIHPVRKFSLVEKIARYVRSNAARFFPSSAYGCILIGFGLLGKNPTAVGLGNSFNKSLGKSFGYAGLGKKLFGYRFGVESPFNQLSIRHGFVHVGDYRTSSTPNQLN